MKATKFIITLYVLALMAACSSHQPRREVQTPSPERQLYTLKHRLKLTDEQLEAVTPIIKKGIEDRHALMEGFDPRDQESMAENRKKLEDLEWNVIKQLSDHLTKEQMDQYCDYLKEQEEAMKERMQEGGPGGGPGGGGGRPGGGGSRF